MNRWTAVSAGVAAGLVLCTGTVLAQTTNGADCKPQKVQGEIIKIEDTGKDQGKLILKGADGKNYEFNASKETLQDKKVGDRLEVTKRLPPNCK